MGLKKTLKKYFIRKKIPSLAAPYFRKRLPREPIVIGGCERSGTTVLLSVLGAHPHIFSIKDETEGLCPTAYTDHIDLNAPFEIDKVYWYLLTSHIPKSCTRWCEKTPKNLWYFARILDYFGSKVQLINIVRDGRDVITSRHPGAPSRFWVDAERWIHDVEYGLQFKEHPAVYTVRYEDLVIQPEETLRCICGFLHEEFFTEMLAHERFTVVTKNRAWDGIVEPLHQRSLNRWQQPEYKERIEAFMHNPRAVQLLQDFGYAT